MTLIMASPLRPVMNKCHHAIGCIKHPTRPTLPLLQPGRHSTPTRGKAPRIHDYLVHNDTAHYDSTSK